MSLIKKIFIFSLMFIIIFILSLNLSFAQSNKKIIFISMNRFNLDDFQNIQSLNEKLKKQGFIGIMNTKASNGSSDIKSYASIGFGTRAYLLPQDIDFQVLNEKNKNIYQMRTNLPYGYINNLNINSLISSNEKGDYGAHIGVLGNEFKNNNLKLSILGNADTDLDHNREIYLLGMDQNGQVPSGNLNLNIKDNSMPFSLRTDYQNLAKETKNSYQNNNLTIVELGDTYRLDLYRPYLNDDSYKKIKSKIDFYISDYLSSVFNMVDKDTRIYIVSPYQKNEDITNGYKLSPIVIFDNNKKGILNSDTTRTEGIIGNIDICADILNYFDINSNVISGKLIHKLENEKNIEFIKYKYEKIVTTSKIRIPILYTYAVFEMIIWIIAIVAIVAILFNKNLHKKYLKIITFILKISFIMPLAFLIIPMLNTSNEYLIIASIIILPLILYFLLYVVIKDDLKILVIISALTSITIFLDTITNQYLMKNCILSYDAIVGARYYGIGNEYEGVILGVFTLFTAGLLHYKKISKPIAIVLLFSALIMEIFPKFGADVGGIFSGGFCFLFFILNIYGFKIDIKKFAFICFIIFMMLMLMVIIDMNFMGSKSHLANSLEKIKSDGLIVVFDIIQRKIAMNIKLLSISIWSKVLIIAIIIVGILFYKPFGILKSICNKYPILYMCWNSIIIGCTFGFLTNDSGVIVAATGITYVVIPVLILIIKDINKTNEA